MFDAGLGTGFGSHIHPEYIFISHTHLDHISKLPFITTNISTNPIVYVPYGTGEFVLNYLNTYNQLNSLDKNEKWNKGKIIEVNPGDVLNVKIAHRDFEIKVFQTIHGITSVGYALSEITNKLKKEFIGLQGTKLKKLRDSNIELTEKITNNLIIYTGDTHNKIFENIQQINWNNYKAIITECTYIEGLSSDCNVYELAEKNCHNVLENLELVSQMYPNPLYILCHWSTRYDKKKLKNILIRNIIKILYLGSIQINYELIFYFY